MTGNRMPFGSQELPTDGAASAAELATSLRIGRDLDSLASEPTIAPRDDFALRVMGAVAREPAPLPLAVVGHALRAGQPLGLLAGLRDAWRVAIGGGRPAFARAQAFALVLVALLAVGSLGGLAGAAAFRIFAPDDAAPTPAPSTVPAVAPNPTASPTASPAFIETPSPSPTAQVTLPQPTARPTTRPTAIPTPVPTPRRTAEPTPRGTDDHGGDGGGETPSPTESDGGLSGPGGGDALSGGGSGSSN
jgi:hypothetical protein